MKAIRGEWLEINQISDTVAKDEREREAKRFPSHPRTDMLEADLMRAIHILNDSDFTVVKEAKEDDHEELRTIAVMAIAKVPKNVDRSTLINLLQSIHWYGKMIFPDSGSIALTPIK